MKIFLVALAIFLAATIAIMNWIASGKEAEITENFPPIGKFITVNDARLHYFESGSGPALVLVHGLSSNLLEMKTTLIDRLSKDFRVVAFDRPGLGHSEPVNDITIRGQAELLADAVGELGLDKPIVVGHSFGGAVALSWAINRPESLSALLVLSGVSYPLEDLPEGIVKVLGSPVSGSVIATIQLLFASDSSLAQEQTEVYAPQAVPENVVVDHGSWLTMRRFSAVENMRQLSGLNEQLELQATHYSNIKIPVEIIHGDSDLIVPYAANALALSKEVPAAKLTVLSDTGHAPNETSPEVVEASIKRLAGQVRVQ